MNCSRNIHFKGILKELFTVIFILYELFTIIFILKELFTVIYKFKGIVYRNIYLFKGTVHRNIHFNWTVHRNIPLINGTVYVIFIYLKGLFTVIFIIFITNIIIWYWEHKSMMGYNKDFQLLPEEFASVRSYRTFPEAFGTNCTK